MDELTDLAKSMLERIDLSDRERELVEMYPEVFNNVASKMKIAIDAQVGYAYNDEPIDYYIQHVGYTSEQLGYDK